MTHRALQSAALLLALAGAAACSDSIKPSGDGKTRFAFTDPTNDTLPSSQSARFLAVDARQLAGYVSNDSLVLVVRYTRPIASPNVDNASSVFGYIELDVDENIQTGRQPVSTNYGIQKNLGIDYVVALYDSAGYAFADNAITFESRPVPIVFDADSETVRIPLSYLNLADGRFQMYAIVGGNDRPSDILPNAGFYTVHRGTTAANRTADQSAPLLARSAGPRASATGSGWTSVTGMLGERPLPPHLPSNSSRARSTPSTSASTSASPL
ncbi:MAG: hypothetical protein M3068_00515 [Gemmatimonadota bacterium]|nr:hypothetical protein [Gemmatimonadota bacterium]